MPLLKYLHSLHGHEAVISLEQFIQAALYAPKIGYYTQPRERVGYREGRDFYTAESLGYVFRELLIASSISLLRGKAEDYHFSELGTEPNSSLLKEQTHPFANCSAFGCSTPIELDGQCIIFSNELFDAQPFRRFEFRDGDWLEHGVLLTDDQAKAVTLSKIDNKPALPESASEGYIYDDPSGARKLIERIVSSDWHGLFIAFDYGLDRETLLTRRPHGTGRTYQNHQMGSDLLQNPGEIDITHHICWDDLTESLKKAGFESILLQPQESFFVHHGASAIAKIVESATNPGISRHLQTLKELLHPEHMGRKFQVLTAYRAKNTCQASDNSR